MNPNLDLLHPYPFEKLNKVKSEVEPPADKTPIFLSIGEPKHEAPAFVVDSLRDNLNSIVKYPATKGQDELRQTISSWATNRFQLKQHTLTPESHILPVNGTREALFAFAQAIVDASVKNASVLMPNPFYQIYEGASYLAGAKPVYLNCTAENGFIPNFDEIEESTWKNCQLLFLCSPGNPTGSVIDSATLQKLINLADKYDFVIASDECYAELYFDESSPPVGLLQACSEMGRHDFKRCIVFHSLSKRSNLPGLRSGFVAGDSDIIRQFLRYRTYHGCAMPVFSQLASIAAWSDENHVKANRELYKKKFTAVLDILDGCLNVSQPDAGFYLWPETPCDDVTFTQKLFAKENVTVLPGSFLARDSQNSNPGEKRIRMALVASLEECIDAAQRIKHFVKTQF